MGSSGEMETSRMTAAATASTGSSSRSIRKKKLGVKELLRFKKIVRPLIGTHRWRMRFHHGVFVGSHVVSAMVKSGMAKSRTEAVQIGRTLCQKYDLFQHVYQEHEFKDGYYFFRFLDESGHTSGEMFKETSEAGETTHTANMDPSTSTIAALRSSEFVVEPSASLCPESQVHMTREEAAVTIESELSKQRKAIDKLEKMIAKNERVAMARLEGDNRAGTVISMKLILRLEAFRDRTLLVIEQLEALQQELNSTTRGEQLDDAVSDHTAASSSSGCSRGGGDYATRIHSIVTMALYSCGQGSPAQNSRYGAAGRANEEQAEYDRELLEMARLRLLNGKDKAAEASIA